MNEQTKKFAYFPLQDKQIHVSEALWLRNQGEIEMNRENPIFFDFKNPSIRSGVYPVSSTSGDKKISRGAYYRYYNKENTKQILFPKKMTNAHLLFQMMFLQLKEFSIEDKNHKRKIQVAIKSAELEYYIKADNNRGIFIDVLLDIDYTIPYSYKYLWNSKLAIEVKVTHAVEPKKKCILQDYNISTYEASVPESIRANIPETNDLLDNEKFRQNKIDYLIKTYKNYDKFTLFGNFIVKSKTENENKESFILLSQFETELTKYKKDKDDLIEEIKIYEEDKLQLTKNINELKRKSNTLKEAIEDDQGLLSDFQRNKRLVEKIRIELEHSEKEIYQLKEENNSLKNNINELENESLLGWLKRKLLNK
ncbi:hypothetical protein [Lysinibacillus fusiformis]